MTPGRAPASPCRQTHKAGCSKRRSQELHASPVSIQRQLWVFRQRRAKHMTSADPAALVSTEWVAAHLSDPDLRILDCTWHHASTNLDGRTQYLGRHLPGSVHFD